jgi:hypothetical protein
MPKRCWTALLLILTIGGCGSESSPLKAPEPSPGVGMAAAINAFKVAGRHHTARAVEPGRQTLAAAPCSGTGRHGVALVQLLAGVPDPRCLVVAPRERILVVNRTGAFHRGAAVTVTVRLGAYSARLAPQQAAIFAAPVDAYLATGLHGLRTKRVPGPAILVVKRRCAPRGRPLRLLKPIARCF